jgi:hypothetical protein
MYSGKLARCVTHLLVSVSASDAKIESIVNEFVPLRCIGNVFDKDTAVEGTSLLGIRMRDLTWTRRGRRVVL